MALRLANGPLVLGKGVGLQIAAPSTPAVFNPANYGTVAGWYDATVGLLDSGGATISADGALVTTWVDQSAAGNNLTAANTPTAKNSIQNGKRVVRFNGTANRMGKAFTLAQPCTIAIVAAYGNAWTSGNNALCAGNSTAGQLYRSAATGINLNAGSAFSASLATQTSWHIYVAVVNGASSVIAIDNVETTGNAGATAVGGFTLGANGAGGNLAACDISEAIVFSNALSSGNRTSLYNALKTRWGL